MYLMEKIALESVLFILEYCDRIPLCDDCVFFDKSMDGSGNGCRMKRFFSAETYNHCKNMLNKKGAENEKERFGE